MSSRGSRTQKRVCWYSHGESEWASVSRIGAWNQLNQLLCVLSAFMEYVPRQSIQPRTDTLPCAVGATECLGE